MFLKQLVGTKSYILLNLKIIRIRKYVMKSRLSVAYGLEFEAYFLRVWARPLILKPSDTTDFRGGGGGGGGGVHVSAM